VPQAQSGVLEVAPVDAGTSTRRSRRPVRAQAMCDREDRSPPRRWHAGRRTRWPTASAPAGSAEQRGNCLRGDELARRRAHAEHRQLLDVAALAFADVSFEVATNTAIGARAGVSPGSLYPFSPNKDAIAEALARRFEARLRETASRQTRARPRVPATPDPGSCVFDAGWPVAGS